MSNQISRKEKKIRKTEVEEIFKEIRAKNFF